LRRLWGVDGLNGIKLIIYEIKRELFWDLNFLILIEMGWKIVLCWERDRII